MTTTILLIRHAAHDHVGKILSGRMPDVPLSAAGGRQAEQLAAQLAGQPLAAIATSPVHRARETAAALGSGRPGATVEISDALDEVEFGDWTGRAFADLADDPDWIAWNATRSTARPPGGERIGDVQTRVMRFAAQIAAQHDGAMVALVSHCDVIRAALAGWLGLGLDHLLRFDCDPASISRVAIGNWGARVISINEGGR